MRAPKRLPLEALQPYLIDLPPYGGLDELHRQILPDPLDLPAIFGNDRAMEVEVGFGKGLFLLNSSLHNPQTNFLGIEIERKYTLFTATRLAKRGIPNARLICADARSVFRDYLPPRVFRAIHVYFPDPWWKKKHRKRRVFTFDFAEQCERVLQVGGRLLFVTDVPDYFDEVQQLLTRFPSLGCGDAPQANLPAHEFDYLTNFERKFRQQEKPIHRACYIKEAAKS